MVSLLQHCWRFVVPAGFHQVWSGSAPVQQEEEDSKNKTPGRWPMQGNNQTLQLGSIHRLEQTLSPESQFLHV